MDIAPNLLTSFLITYFYHIENELNTTENGLEKIKFQSEEANTDEHLKKYFQAYMLKYHDLSKIKLHKLAIKTDQEEYFIDISQLKSYKIIRVFLPEELTPEQRYNIAEAKKSVYTNPDLYLEITDGVNIYFESVELKSTKDNNIPGSSVQQISPFEWVIFVKREKDKVVVTTGFYINSITEKLPFPDRSPRPQIGFKTLLDWNKKYRKVENNTLLVENLVSKNIDKIKLLTDWQDFLANDWLEIILMEESKNSEKWFNNAIRKFAIKLLDYTDTLTDNEKDRLKSNLIKLIK